MSLRWRPRLSFPDLALALSLPMRAPRPTSQRIGAGSEESAALVPSVWPGTLKRGLVLVLEGVESEWPSVRAFLERAQLREAFEFQPDQDALDTYLVRLERPEIDDEIAPEDGPTLGTWRRTIQVSSVNGEAIHIPYFGL